MPNMEVTVNVYGAKKVQETLQFAAMVVDEFNAIPQLQLMHVIDAARNYLPEMCERLDKWLDHLDEVEEKIKAYRAANNDGAQNGANNGQV